LLQTQHHLANGIGRQIMGGRGGQGMDIDAVIDAFDLGLDPAVPMQSPINTPDSQATVVRISV
jgi:hypothetical protein